MPEWNLLNKIIEILWFSNFTYKIRGNKNNKNLTYNLQI